MNFFWCLVLSFAVYLSTNLNSLEFSQFAEAFECFTEINITVRDGTPLHTCIDFPLSWKSGSGPIDIVMDRSPYGAFNTELVADVFLLENYAAVRQDMRGTHLSGGNFTMWLNAADDSFDSMKFLSEQSWSSGTMFAVGASADGLAVFADPKDSPKWLKAAFIIFSSNTGYDIIYPGGAYRLSLTNFWLKKTVPKEYEKLIAEVRSNEAPGVFWDRLNSSSTFQNVVYPTVIWAGWYDIFLYGSLSGFESYQTKSPSAGSHRIVIDPLGHCQQGAKYFPSHTILGRAALPVLLGLELFKPSGSIPENVKAVTFYVMGAHGELNAPGNYWTSLDAFPKPLFQNYYFHDDLTLSTQIPSSNSSSLTFIYDPADPVPSIGGNNLEITCGPLDQRPIENRDDVLLFTSKPLTQPLAITGGITATLYVSSNATDTDFTVKLTDVYPSGESSLIQDGILRMKWRLLPLATEPSLIQPGKVYEIHVSLWNSSFIFQANHSLRVAVSSSNYPRYDYNTNSGSPINITKPSDNVTASNTLYLSSSYPSYITLPVIPDWENALPSQFVYATDPVKNFLAKKDSLFVDKFWAMTAGVEESLLAANRQEVDQKPFIIVE